MRNGSFKLHRLMRYRMVEAEHIGVEAQATKRIISIAILHIATHRMTHISCVNTYLVFASSLQLKLHKRISLSAVERVEMSNGVFATIIDRTAKCKESPIVLQPVFNRSLVVFHLTREHGHISTIEHSVVPIALQR